LWSLLITDDAAAVHTLLWRATEAGRLTAIASVHDATSVRARDAGAGRDLGRLLDHASTIGPSFGAWCIPVDEPNFRAHRSHDSRRTCRPGSCGRGRVCLHTGPRIGERLRLPGALLGAALFGLTEKFLALFLGETHVLSLALTGGDDLMLKYFVELVRP
jgi:hypothetical protein